MPETTSLEETLPLVMMIIMNGCHGYHICPGILIPSRWYSLLGANELDAPNVNMFCQPWSGVLEMKWPYCTLANKSLNEYGESPSNGFRCEIHIQWIDFFQCSISSLATKSWNAKSSLDADGPCHYKNNFWECRASQSNGMLIRFWCSLSSFLTW